MCTLGMHIRSTHPPPTSQEKSETGKQGGEEFLSEGGLLPRGEIYIQYIQFVFDFLFLSYFILAQVAGVASEEWKGGFGAHVAWGCDM